MRIEDMTLDEKIDEILKYQRRLHNITIIKGIISFSLFMILVVLPMIGFYYWFQSFQENYGMNLSEIGETLQQVKSITDIDEIENFRNLLN